MSWGEITCASYGECTLENISAVTCNKQCHYYRLKHNTENESCWCEPDKIVMENGNKVIVHREEQ